MAKAAHVSALRPGEIVELTIDKPAAGGRMIARHAGQVILVSGAIPGERVQARIERAEKRVAFATAIAVGAASPDRRAGIADPSCGGCLYSHITYARQLALKASIVEDAFARIGKVAIPETIAVAASPERGYRMRARFHVAGGRPGFFREGTHVLCEPRSTGQLTSAAIDAVEGAVARVERGGAHVSSVELTENIAGDQRALSLETDGRGSVARSAAVEIVESGWAIGCSIAAVSGGRTSAGELRVADPLPALTGGRAAAGDLGRHPDAFFQANRYLVPALVGAVLDAVEEQGPVLDLYAGVGLFSVSLAAAGRGPIVAIEGDRASGADLQTNAGPFGAAVALFLESVEDYLERAHPAPQTVIVDPPRTGMSGEALGRVAALAPPRIIYVSCDPATMARDARRLVDAGYRLTSLQAFDLFPNTPHVESLGLFDR